MKVRWIKQEDAHGCGLATLAMLTGKTYGEVKADFLKYPKRFESGRFASRGITYLQIEGYLAEHGYAVARKCGWHPISVRKRKFPPKPFADVHYCEVEQFSNNWHFIVWLGDGTILDPLTDEKKTFADYKRIASVSAVVKL